MKQGLSRKTPALVLVFIIALGTIVARSGAQTITQDSGFLNCYRRTREIVLRSSAVAQHLKTVEYQKLEAPVEANKLGWRFSFEQLPTELSDRLKTVLVSVCLELHPSARKDLSAPDLQHYLDGILDTDRKMKLEGRAESQIEMVVLFALLNQDTEIGEILGPVLFNDIRSSLLSRVRQIFMPEAEAEYLSLILSYPFGSLRFITPHPFMKFSAAVFGSHDLNVHLGELQSDDFLPMIVHESCHLNSRAALLREKPINQLSDEDWTFLTLREEFRASYVAMRFERAWNGHAPKVFSASSLAASSDDESLHELFNGFLKTIQFVHPRQERAVKAFLQNYYSGLPASAQESLLNNWLNWD